MPATRAKAIPIAVFCDGADPATQRRLRQAVRMGLGQADQALPGWPALSISVAVLETVGTPGQTDDLGTVVAACRICARPAGWHATIRLATTAEGQALTDNNRLTALWVILDWLLDWQPTEPASFTVPYLAARSGQPAAPASPAPDLPAMSPVPAGAVVRPPRRVGATTASAAPGSGPVLTTVAAVPAPIIDAVSPGDETPASYPADNLTWPPEPPESEPGGATLPAHDRGPSLT